VRRQLLMIGVAATLLVGMSACGGSDGDKAAPKPTKTTPSPTPTTPAQPKGAFGMTVKIQNWDDYATDPAVLGYKRASEASGGSMNQHKLVPDATKLLSKPVLRLVSGNVANGKKQRWSVPDVAHIKIVSSRTRGSEARLVTCQWAPSTDVLDRNGKLLGKVKREWRKYSITLKLKAGAWVLQPIKHVGTCPGGAPQ
jgi:hypothetical protein